MERGSRTRFQHSRRRGLDPFDTDGHDEIYPGAVRSEAGLSRQPQADDNDEGRTRVWEWNPSRSPAKPSTGTRAGAGSSGAWLAYFPEEKLALAYTTNAKIYPVRNIVSGVFDIYWNRPFQIPAFDAFDVSPEVLDRYVGVYTIPGTPAKMTVTRDGRDALHSAGAEPSGCPARSNGRGQIQDRSWASSSNSTPRKAS